MAIMAPEERPPAKPIAALFIPRIELPRHSVKASLAGFLEPSHSGFSTFQVSLSLEAIQSESEGVKISVVTQSQFSELLESYWIQAS